MTSKMNTKEVAYALDFKEGGDIFEIGYFSTEEKAFDAAQADRSHMSDYDRKRCSHSVWVYEVPEDFDPEFDTPEGDPIRSIDGIHAYDEKENC